MINYIAETKEGVNSSFSREEFFCFVFFERWQYGLPLWLIPSV